MIRGRIKSYSMNRKNQRLLSHAKENIDLKFSSCYCSFDDYVTSGWNGTGMIDLDSCDYWIVLYSTHSNDLSIDCSSAAILSLFSVSESSGQANNNSAVESKSLRLCWHRPSAAVGGEHHKIESRTDASNSGEGGRRLNGIELTDKSSIPSTSS
jgi:hypothetical protein